MTPFGALCRKELLGMLRSPGTWMLLAGFQFLAAVFFLVVLGTTSSSDLAGVYFDLGMLALILAPMLTAAAFGPEWREGTMELLLTSAVKPRHLVLAKYLGAVGVLALATVLSVQFPFWVAVVGQADPGAAVAGLGGSFLLGATVAAMGTFAAAATRSTPAAALLGFALALGFYFVHSLGLVFGIDEGNLPDRFSFYLRFGLFTRGLVDTGDVAFFVLFAAAFLAMATAALEAARSARD
ncbi:MAG: ABC transporter permease subunit [Candidatus Riflebacteria bacterium]|nr:ABC transporter permease subunit [Candidatus Riflebacteria bacterium]